MAHHIVIRREEWVAGTGERPQVGVFTQTHAARPPVPWGRIAVGETVWMKWSGGPIVTKATVSGLFQLRDCTSDRLRETTRGFLLHELDEYWDYRPPLFFGMTVYLDEERWLKEVIEPEARSYSESWVVLETKAEEKKWLKPGKSHQRADARSTRSRRSLPASVRFKVLRRDGFTCVYCGRKPPEVRLQVDHVKPRSKGGSDALQNLRAACVDCNLGKGVRSIHS